MRIVTIDFESLFTDDYTLKKLSTEAYIRDKRFEPHGAAIKWSADTPARWYDARQLEFVLKQEDWSDTAILCHHAQFDGFILSHWYHVEPKLWLDTLSMARLLLGNHLSVSLDSVRAFFGLPNKRTPYEKFKNKHWHELDEATQIELADGCCDEVESIWTIFCKLAKQFPRSQYEVVDCLIRMFVDPVLVGDTEFFARVWQAENNKKQKYLKYFDVSEAEFQSAEKFAGLLRAFGEEPAFKNGKNGEIYAFARTDEYMQSLLEHEDPYIASLAQARLGIKSTIQQTRAETLGFMSTRGPLAIYARAYGARTTRPSGGDKSNFLNMKKVDPDMPKLDTNATLKEGICAPDGYLLAAVDASQIDCRLANTVAGQWDVVENFRNGGDPYVGVATEFYGYLVNKKDHPKERQLGKVVELQSGYGSGGEKIRHTLRTKAGIVISEADGLKARDAYRSTHPAVEQMWRDGGRMLARLAGGPPIQWGPVELRNNRMWLPNGCPIIYDTLEYHQDQETFEEGWRVKTRKGWEKLYGAKLFAEMIQGLTQTVVSDAMVRINRAGIRTLNFTYDELLLLIKRDGHEQKALEFCLQEMKRTPEWLPGIPLDAEGGLSERYAK